VSCSPPGRWYFADPRLVAEVLSPSTEKEDRTSKLDFYRSLPSVAAVLLVWQEVRRVELHSRAGEIWQVRPVIGGGEIGLDDLGVALPLDEVYADI
jgi:Uma2 family endonuclease